LRRDEQARPVAILETSNDITQRKRREEEIQRLNQELAKGSMERTLSDVLCRAALSRTSLREPAVSGTDRIRQDAHWP
jgi:hypothetical protein